MARRTGKKSSASSTEGSAAHEYVVVLERIEQQMRVVAEGVTGSEHRMITRMDELERRLVLRIEALEIAVRKNSEDIGALKTQVEKLTEEVRGKPNREDLVRLERRVAQLEQKLGVSPPA